MTIPEKIKSYLSGKGWVNKGEIERHISIIHGSYGDTVARAMRRMREKGRLLERSVGKGTEWKLPAQAQTLAERAEASRKQREQIERDKPLQLF